MAARKQAPMWGARRQVIAAVGVLACLACALPWWPAAATLWAFLLTAGWAWPPKERWEEATPGHWKAADAKRLRNEMLAPLKSLRLGPRSGCGLQDDANPPPTRARPVTVVSGAAALGAAVAWFADLGLSEVLSSPALPRLVIPQIGAHSGERMTWLTTWSSAVFGWWIVHAWGEVRRHALFRGEDGWDKWGLAPSAVIGNWAGAIRPGGNEQEPPDSPGAWARMASEVAVSRPFAAAVLGAVVALFAARWSNIPSAAIGWTATLGLLASAAVIAFAVPAWRRMAHQQHEEWHAIKYEERQWEVRWVGALGVNINELQVPTIVEIEDRPADNPTHRAILFWLKPGTAFFHFEKATGQIASSVGSLRVLIEQFQRTEGEESLDAFQVSYQLPDVDLGVHPHLVPRDPDDTETTDFVIKYAVVTAFREAKLHTPMFIGCTTLTKPGAPPLYQTAWKLTGGDVYADLAAKVPQLTERLNCQWCRPFLMHGTGWVGLLIGADPAKTKLAVPQIQSKLDAYHWSWVFSACRVLGTNGAPPTLAFSRTGWMGVTEWTFKQAPGIEDRLVHSKLEAIKSLSEHSYAEMAQHPDPGKFVLLTGESDPLQGAHLFTDHEVLFPPVRGEPRIDWAVGVAPTGDLRWYGWDHEEPHLLVAGSSGSGKSGVVNSMLCQLLHNSHPDDLRLALVEPKNELQAYQHMEHVTRFIDPLSSPDPYHDVFGALLDEAVAEMNRRYASFTRHPAQPQKLAEARALARSDPTTAGHLNYPYLMIVVEECADYFVPPMKEEREGHAHVMRQVLLLARKARAAGIHMVLATQFPKKECLSTQLKGQCRRIGLSCGTMNASMVVIDQPGLERISGPGRGLVSDGKSFVPMRGLLLIRDPDEGRDDRGDIISQLPHTPNWPKLPAGVTPSPDIAFVGTPPPEIAPVPGFGPGTGTPHPFPVDGGWAAEPPPPGPGSDNGQAPAAPETEEMLSAAIAEMDLAAFLP